MTEEQRRKYREFLTLLRSTKLKYLRYGRCKNLNADLPRDTSFCSLGLFYLDRLNYDMEAFRKNEKEDKVFDFRDVIGFSASIVVDLNDDKCSSFEEVAEELVKIYGV